MNEIDVDIIERISKDYSKDDAIKVVSIIQNIFLSGSSVGVSQLARSILFLSNGNFNEIKKLLGCDPRDVILAAERKAGNPGHYFDIPFPEIDNFFERMFGFGDYDNESHSQ